MPEGRGVGGWVGGYVDAGVCVECDWSVIGVCVDCVSAWVGG